MKKGKFPDKIKKYKNIHGYDPNKVLARKMVMRLMQVPVMKPSLLISKRNRNSDPTGNVREIDNITFQKITEETERAKTKFLYFYLIKLFHT